MSIKQSIEKVQQYKPLMDSFIRARNPYELRHFVIGKHDDKIQQYKQLLVEMDVKYRAIEEAQTNIEIKNLEIEEKKLDKISNTANRKDEIHNEKIDIEVFKLERENKYTYLSMLGALAECKDFVRMLEVEYKDLTGKTEDELLVCEKEYWVSRLAKQCEVDILTNGKVGAGNLDTLLKLPKQDQAEIMQKSFERINEFKQFTAKIEREALISSASSNPILQTQFNKSDYIPLVLRKDAPDGYPSNRIVDMDIIEIMIATLHRPGDNEWASSQFYIPAGKNHIIRCDVCPSGELIGEYKSRMVKDAISLRCTHLFIVDDDVVIDNSALQRLYAHNLDIVGGWYLKKTPIAESATLVKDGNSRMPVPTNTTGLVEVDWSLTAGLTLYKVDVFKGMEYPYFYTSEKGTEDTYFTQKAINHGYKSYLDTSIKAGHLDKQTRKVYTFKEAVNG